MKKTDFTKNLLEEITQKCRFCNPPDKERILNESDNFYIMLSLGQITEGYLLIISKQHIESCAQIPSNLKKEFEANIQKVKDVLGKEYGSCIFFEHGRAASCLRIPDESGSKHCYHAHLHCVPVNFSVNQMINKSLMTFGLKSLDEFYERYNQIQLPYLFVYDMEMKIHFIEHEIRRQYLRYLVAKGIGQEHLWNWIDYPEFESISSARQKLVSKF